MRSLAPSVIAALVLFLGCGEEHEPRNAPVAAEPEPTPTVVPQTNDCPAEVQCHPAWRACHCARNARGDLATMEADFDGDGAPDMRITYEYDEAGNLLRWSHDRGADGSIEMPCTFSPPCPPPHPNDDCQCYGAPREVTPEYVEERLRRAGDTAQPVDPDEAQRIIDAVEPPP